MKVAPFFSSGLETYRATRLGLEAEGSGARLQIDVVSDQILHLRASPDGQFSPRRSWAVTPPEEAFPGADFSLQESAESLSLVTAAFDLTIEQPTGRLSFSNRSGQVFCADREGAARIEEEGALPGVTLSKRIEPGEHFFGFGERTGGLDKLGRKMTHWNSDPATPHTPSTDPLYISIPVCLAVRPGLAYGLFFNHTRRSSFDMGRERADTWQFSAEGGELDYYLVYGPTPQDVTSGLGRLLGTMPLPPRWALGYHQSRWGYRNEAMLREVAANFREKDIPCDVIHLDIDHMHGYRVFTWDPQRFPHPEELLGDLRKEGFHAVTIVDPGVKVDPRYPIYQAGLERDAFIHRADGEVFHGYVWPDDAVFSDYAQPAVRDWWGDLQKDFVRQGVSGIWNDMNEPTVFSSPFSQPFTGVGTIDLQAPQGPAQERTTHAEMHNLYGTQMAMASYQGLKRHLNGERPFVLTRSAFAGVQRWSACWMGDNHSWWEHLEMSMPQLMSMGLSGVPFVGADIGGFADEGNAELFARWMQLGALTPFCRGHSSWETHPNEPWAYGPRVEAICREYLKLRYRLMPYLYSLFWEAAQQGAPVLRPLLYHYPDDPTTYSLADEFLLGAFLLAAPIYRPGSTYRHVYLPQGVWYDWWSGERLQGEAHVLAHAPLEKLPLYVRSGAILPLGPEVSFVDERPLDALRLDLFPGDGAFTLYEDDGHTFRYEQGEYCTTSYRLRQDGSTLRLEIGPRTGPYLSPRQKLELRLHARPGARVEGYPQAEYLSEPGVLALTLADAGEARTITYKLPAN